MELYQLMMRCRGTSLVSRNWSYSSGVKVVGKGGYPVEFATDLRYLKI